MITADNITTKQIDLLGYVLRTCGERCEALWQAGQWGDMSPADAATEINEMKRRIELAFEP